MACYPDLVSGDNPMSLVVVCLCRRPRLGQFSGVPVWDSLAMTVAGVMRTQGPPKADLRGRMRAGGTMKESRVKQVLLKQCWSTRVGSRGQVLHSVGKVRNLCRVKNLFE